ncbi:hypothetical protein AB0A94_22770 [Streptomyces sp. NPDC044984]
MTTADLYGHPVGGPAGVRKAVLRDLCPRGTAPRVRRVPWCAA